MRTPLGKHAHALREHGTQKSRFELPDMLTRFVSIAPHGTPTCGNA
jgi:hypothetical protein